MSGIFLGPSFPQSRIIEDSGPIVMWHRDPSSEMKIFFRYSECGEGNISQFSAVSGNYLQLKNSLFKVKSLSQRGPPYDEWLREEYKALSLHHNVDNLKGLPSELHQGTTEVNLSLYSVLLY